MHAAAQSGNAEILKALLDKGAKVNLADGDGRTPLFVACEANNEETTMYLIRALDGQPENQVNKPDRNGSTPLGKAASWGNTDVIRLLLSRIGPSAVNAGDKRYRQTALHKAAVKGRRAALEVLIEQGGNLSLEDKNKLTPLQLCIRFWIEKQDETVAMEETLTLLIQHRAPPSSALDSLMFTAAAKGSVRVIESLIATGVDPKMEDSHGWTPIMLAEHHDKRRVVDMLSNQRKPGGRRPSSWRDMDQRIEISDDRLEVRCIGPNFYGKTVTTDHPTPATVTRYYFEIEIALNEAAVRNPKINERLVIGATTLPAILNAACLDRTWTAEEKEYSFKKSYGWNTIENSRHEFRHGYHSGPPGGKCKIGDVVGCGIDYNQKILFFTKNGQRVEERYGFTNVSGRLHPAVSLEGRFIARANFGHKSFKWEGWKAWSTGL